MSDDQIRLVSSIATVIFLAALGFSTVSIAIRGLRYRRAGKPVPVLLPRDLILTAGIFVPFGAVLLVRALALGPALRNNPVWVLGTTGLAVISALTFAFYEAFVIERRGGGE